MQLGHRSTLCFEGVKASLKLLRNYGVCTDLRGNLNLQRNFCGKGGIVHPIEVREVGRRRQNKVRRSDSLSIAF